MEYDELEDELISLAERLGATVRHVRYEGEGGLCTIGGRNVLIINDLLDVPDRIDVIARDLAGLPGLDEVYIVPEVRAIIDKHASKG
jgi:hypothetical protein